ncbi:unnamed protein product [Dovyalis caffra]|uniref:Uncharacterized protein n=1 Tax=Dovyalis caffra TaxID=77055 RepID=A0AAV1QNH5_9ROSI|nr:unnamed protein product [Dovyalis caffra]
MSKVRSGTEIQRFFHLLERIEDSKCIYRSCEEILASMSVLPSNHGYTEAEQLKKSASTGSAQIKNQLKVESIRVEEIGMLPHSIRT